jgi:hypothetical protein
MFKPFTRSNSSSQIEPSHLVNPIVKSNLLTRKDRNEHIEKKLNKSGGNYLEKVPGINDTTLNTNYPLLNLVDKIETCNLKDYIMVRYFSDSIMDLKQFKILKDSYNKKVESCIILPYIYSIQMCEKQGIFGHVTCPTMPADAMQLKEYAGYMIEERFPNYETLKLEETNFGDKVSGQNVYILLVNGLLRCFEDKTGLMGVGGEKGFNITDIHSVYYQKHNDNTSNIVQLVTGQKLPLTYDIKLRYFKVNSKRDFNLLKQELRLLSEKFLKQPSIFENSTDLKTLIHKFQTQVAELYNLPQTLNKAHTDTHISSGYGYNSMNL